MLSPACVYLITNTREALCSFFMQGLGKTIQCVSMIGAPRLFIPFTFL